MYTESKKKVATMVMRASLEDWLDTAENLRTDPDKKIRHDKQRCPMCYYTTSAGGSGGTLISYCSLCGAMLMYPSIYAPIDALCHDCAKSNDSCVRCGAELDLGE